MQALTGIKKITDRAKVNGTGKQGDLRASYGVLVAAFGEPSSGASDDGKIQAEWWFMTAHGPATIHDYKDSRPARDIDVWSIGGKKAAVVEDVMEALREAEAHCGYCGYHETRCRCAYNERISSAKVSRAVSQFISWQRAQARVNKAEVVLQGYCDDLTPAEVGEYASRTQDWLAKFDPEEEA